MNICNLYIRQMIGTNIFKDSQNTSWKSVWLHWNKEKRGLETFNRETLHADKQEKYSWFICYD